MSMSIFELFYSTIINTTSEFLPSLAVSLAISLMLGGIFITIINGLRRREGGSKNLILIIFVIFIYVIFLVLFFTYNYSEIISSISETSSFESNYTLTTLIILSIYGVFFIILIIIIIIKSKTFRDISTSKLALTILLLVLMFTSMVLLGWIWDTAKTSIYLMMLAITIFVFPFISAKKSVPGNLIIFLSLIVFIISGFISYWAYNNIFVIIFYVLIGLVIYLPTFYLYKKDRKSPNQNFIDWNEIKSSLHLN